MQHGSLYNEYQNPHSRSTQYNSTRRRTPAPEKQAGVGAFMGTVYAWMTGGLALSATVAYGLSTQPEILTGLFTGGFGLLILLVPFLLIFVLSARMSKASMFECAFYYLLMTGIMGSWLTGIAVQASADPAFASIVFQSLGITVAMFGGMSLTGWITKKDLSEWGSFLTALLWGLITVSVLNIFVIQSVGLSIAYHIVGVVLFAAITAYDTQKIKTYYYENGGHHGLAIWGALTLYLDFINIFLHILQLFGAGGSSNSD